MAGVRVAADVGGTFTDLACVSADGRLTTCKLPSTPDDFSVAILEGLAQLLDGTVPAEVLHASTVATNAILEGRGALTALLTTEGFRDVLELRRIRVPRLYEPLYQKPPPLVPRARRFEVAERLDARGAVVRELDESAVRALGSGLAAAGVEAVAIAFLHSYANPAHERRAAQLLREALPHAFISVSSEVLPEIREYERTSTTVVNAYVGQVVSRYLGSFRDRLADAGLHAPLRMMVSSGGIVDVERVVARPATVVESGPAAGVVGATMLAASAGYDNLITFDMGGTTAKAALVEGGRLAMTDDYEVGGGISLSSRLAKGGGYALKLPVVDVSEVGAGGGSLVRVDAAGSLRVGPESAGAVPGPACYARGGEEPTVTDASVVLGYLNPRALAGGTVRIEATRATQAVGRIAARLGIGAHQAAHGIFRLANATMMRAVKAVSTYRGRDPREFALFAFGGNGGIHAAALASELGIRRVIVPPAAGVFSAVGLLCANREATRAVAFLRPLDEAALEDAVKRCRALSAEALAELAAPTPELRWRADLRYAGQGFELPVDLEADAGADTASLARLRTRFESEYARTYGHAPRAGALEFVALRIVASWRAAADVARWRHVCRSAAAPSTTRKAWFGDAHGECETPVLDRPALAGRTLRGPLIIEEYEGTTVVPPGAEARLDARGAVIIDLHPERAT